MSGRELTYVKRASSPQTRRSENATTTDLHRSASFDFIAGLLRVPLIWYVAVSLTKIRYDLQKRENPRCASPSLNTTNAAAAMFRAESRAMAVVETALGTT
jgi:hypothetical protein